MARFGHMLALSWNIGEENVQQPGDIRHIKKYIATFLRDALWNALTAGASGVEAYYGYKTGCSDLDCQDHRTRARISLTGMTASWAGPYKKGPSPLSWAEPVPLLIVIGGVRAPLPSRLANHLRAAVISGRL